MTISLRALSKGVSGNWVAPMTPRDSYPQITVHNPNAAAVAVIVIILDSAGNTMNRAVVDLAPSASSLLDPRLFPNNHSTVYLRCASPIFPGGYIQRFAPAYTDSDGEIDAAPRPGSISTPTRRRI